MELGRQGKLAAVKSAAGGREMDRRFLIAARCAVYMTLGAVMSCARVLNNEAPLGMAMVAASGAGLTGVFALAGAAMGYLLSGGVEWGIRYIASAVLVYTVAFIFQETKIYRSSSFMPFTAAVIMALTGYLKSFTLSADALPTAAAVLLESTLAFGGCYFFSDALDGRTRSSESAELKHTVALLIFGACALMAISRIVVFSQVSIGRVIAVLVVMVCAMKGGMLNGAAVGTVFGLSMDIACGGPAFYTMAYAFSGMLSGVFSRHGRIVFVIAYIMSNALAVVAQWQSSIHLEAMFEVFSASVIFMLLPQSALSRVGAMLQKMDGGSGEAGLRQFTALRVRNLSEAYGDLYSLVERSVTAPYNDENIAKVFDRAADQVCVKCKNKNLCWNQNYMDTLSAMNDATKAMNENGSLRALDLPEHFRAQCDDLQAFVTAVNGELRSLSYRRLLRSRIIENRSVAWGQYNDISNVLGRVASELGSVNGSEPLIERRLIRYLKTMDIDADTAVFRDGNRRLHVIIESGRLTPLTSDKDYLSKLSEVVGARLCLPANGAEGSSRLSLLEAEPLAVSVGVAAMKKRGERINGDNGSYFKTDSGMLCVILSDGMGSGDKAAAESGEVVHILEKFLRSDVDGGVAMKILNSVMLLKAGDGVGYATADLMCVDLFTGNACFYKYGAAPSYVRNGKSIKRIKGETLAPGLSLGDGVAPDLVRMKLSPGCTAIVASDGLLSGNEDGWLRELLLQSGDDMKALARSALREAEARNGAEDDMTVITVHVEERE